MEQETDNKTLEFHEVEVKFRLDASKLDEWKLLVSGLKGQKDFDLKEWIAVDSDDIYFTRPPSKDMDYEFVRYRFSDDKKQKRAELTTKCKLSDANNIIRKEFNLRVDNNSKETVEAFIESLGFKRSFTITKHVQIYRFEDATLPYYTVIDDKGKRNTFIEIEVNEEKIHKLTKTECWAIIEKYEKVLAPLGISAKNRLRKSLFEMYKP